MYQPPAEVGTLGQVQSQVSFSHNQTQNWLHLVPQRWPVGLPAVDAGLQNLKQAGSTPARASIEAWPNIKGTGHRARRQHGKHVPPRPSDGSSTWRSGRSGAVRLHVQIMSIRPQS